MREGATTATGQSAQRVPVALLLLFLLSGAAGLIYQVVWTRYLTTVLGSTTQAVAAVVAAFMGGLALGAFVAGRSSVSGVRAIRTYGLIEIGVGLYALAFPTLLRVTDQLYMQAYPLVEGQTAATLGIRLALSLGLLVLPTALMGATLPILIVGVVRDPAAASKPVAAMYGINTLGAVLGTVACGFILIPHHAVQSIPHKPVPIPPRAVLTSRVLNNAISAPFAGRRFLETAV